MTPAIGNICVFLNPKDPNCFGVRNWWRNNLPELELLNPMCTMSIQEMSFGEPHMFLQYSPVDMRMVRLAGATEEEFEDIMESCVTYGTNHALLERPRTDDGGDLVNQSLITNFGYTESFMSKLEVSPPSDTGMKTTDGIDDPGQKARVMPRNAGLKLAP